MLHASVTFAVVPDAIGGISQVSNLLPATAPSTNDVGTFTTFAPFKEGVNTQATFQGLAVAVVMY